MNDWQEFAVRVLIAVVAVTWLVVLWRGNRDPGLANFRIQGLIMTKDGFIDRVAFMELGSWLAYSMIVLWLTVHDSLTETYATIYIAFPTIRAGLAGSIKAFAPQPQAPTTITTTDTATHETKIRGPDDH